ncbi:uncharacterized protein LOC135378344 [Ornithodoros turicata]|uniref:uncharacterized protein LOC135378344 n=1 Tax=Ornithodoros turicata TaxID=34597 RepID=UPI003139D6BE
MRDACMPLKKWASNCSEIQDHVDSTKSGVSQHELIRDTEGDETARVLGLTWDTRPDTLNFNGPNVLEALSQVGDSKRSVLQTVAKIFDPLGLAAPFAIKAKMVFQQLWQQGVGWDKPIPDSVKCDWDSWKAELADLLNVSVPRNLKRGIETITSTQLHLFSDASPLAYGTCAYLRCEDYDGNVQCTLILSKARLAPLKKLSLPRLELMGALIAARTAKFVKHALRMPSVPTYFWADSSIALTWIKGRAARWKVFVCNRVTEIQATSTADQWRYCPGKQNPADCLTRGMTIHALLRSSHWWEGPNWLKDGESQWPKFDAPSRTEESNMEACSNSSQVMHVTLEKVEPLMDIQDFSSHVKLLRVTAWARRFIDRCKKAAQSSAPWITAEEINAADEYWIKVAQQESFPHEVQELKRGCAIPKASKIGKLQPYLDKYGIMRLKGRLEFSPETETVKHPIILDKRHRLSYLIVNSAHRRTQHGGVQATMNDVRERWWVTQARQLTKSVLSRCGTCRRFRAQAATSPTAPLPLDRVHQGHPFETVGIDFAGPLYVSSKKNSERRVIHLCDVKGIALGTSVGPHRRLLPASYAPFYRSSRDPIHYLLR